jgi:hypothetical protein
MFRRFLGGISTALFAVAVIFATAGSSAGSVHTGSMHPAGGCDTHKCYF